MALMMDTFSNQNLNKNLQLPITIIPITHDALPLPANRIDSTQPPKADLTFHCMCCQEYFVNPCLMYEHLNTKHADLPVPQEESEEELDDGKDYSWVFEPLCELVAPDGEGNARQSGELQQNGHNDAADKPNDAEDSDSDTDSDDDDSSSTSSSSTSSSSSSDSSAASNAQDALAGHENSLAIGSLNMNDNTTMEVMEEAAYEEVEADSSQQSNAQFPSIKLKTADPRESTSIILLNPETNTTIAPIVPTMPNSSVIRRGRGRRSAAQQAALEMSSLISGEPKCFQCSHCEASFPSAGDLSKHVRCHITNKPFQCSICEKTFTHIGSLNTHIRIHSGERPYKCELCNKAFTQSSSLMVHVRSHAIKKPHQCHLCDKGFMNSTSLMMHLKTHKDGANYSCSECDKVFKHEAQLQEHLQMHTQQLLYQCAICRSSFPSSSELVQHMKSHLGDKPFTCSLCDRSFTQSGSLNIHMRIHTGEKPFQCKICNKTFTQASSLSVHTKIHSGEKTFPCNICGKSYSQAAYLNKHIQNHLEAQRQSLETAAAHQTQVETLLCIVCGDLHKDAASLALHVTQKHAALLHNAQDANSLATEEEQYMQQMQIIMQLQQQLIRNNQNPFIGQNMPTAGGVEDDGEDEEELPEEEEEEEVEEKDDADRQQAEIKSAAVNSHGSDRNFDLFDDDSQEELEQINGQHEQRQLNEMANEQQQIEEEPVIESPNDFIDNEIMYEDDEVDADDVVYSGIPLSSMEEIEEMDSEYEEQIANNELHKNTQLLLQHQNFVDNNSNGTITYGIEDEDMQQNGMDISEYPWIEGAEFDDFDDDYAAEEEVETEE